MTSTGKQKDRTELPSRKVWSEASPLSALDSSEDVGCCRRPSGVLRDPAGGVARGPEEAFDGNVPRLTSPDGGLLPSLGDEAPALSWADDALEVGPQPLTAGCTVAG